jgi:hypothetical protein
MGAVHRNRNHRDALLSRHISPKLCGNVRLSASRLADKQDAKPAWRVFAISKRLVARFDDVLMEFRDIAWRQQLIGKRFTCDERIIDVV